MPKVNQLTVRCANRPGTLAHIALLMGDAKVNILGFLLTTSGSKGFVKLVVDNVGDAKAALEDAGLSYTERPFYTQNSPMHLERWGALPEG